NTGIISTVAGNGEPGFSGDGGKALEAAISTPTAVTIDGTDDLFVLDMNNARVRRIDGGTGLIDTYTGSGPINSNGNFGNFSGDGGPAVSASLNPQFNVQVDKNGILFIPDTLNTRVRRVNAAEIKDQYVGDGTQGLGGEGGPAVEASLNRPQNLAVD